MELLRRTMHRKTAERNRHANQDPNMATNLNPISDITISAVEAAARFTKISMDSAERTLAVQL